MRNNDLVDEFGKDIVIKARDYTISNIERLFLGKTKGETGALFKEIQNLPPETLSAIQQLLVHYVDGAIHDLFVKFNESFGKYKIISKDESGKEVDLIEASDGLNYEYFIFIDEFSKYNSAYDDPDSNDEWKLEKD